MKQTLESASSADANRNAVQQKIGDYYASCMDEPAINNQATAAIKPELDRIAALSDKSQLAGEIAHVHALTFQLAPGTNSGSSTAAFGFSSQQDFDNASQVVASADQGGLGLPDRDYYTRDDAKSVELRQQYLTHVQKMLALHIYVQVPRWLQIVEPLTIRIVRQRILAALRRLPGIEIPVRCL